MINVSVLHMQYQLKLRLDQSAFVKTLLSKLPKAGIDKYPMRRSRKLILDHERFDNPFWKANALTNKI